jgi:hypothetical protein
MYFYQGIFGNFNNRMLSTLLIIPEPLFESISNVEKHTSKK